MKTVAALAVAAVALAGCGGSGGGVPSQFAGTWGADCSSPYVKFDGDTVHVYPDTADYKIKAASLNGSDLKVSYDTPSGQLTDVYASEGATLRLTKTVSADGQEAAWTKAPMSKCP